MFRAFALSGRGLAQLRRVNKLLRCVANALSAFATQRNNQLRRAPQARASECDGKQTGTKRHLLPYCREGQEDVPSFVAFLPAW